MNAWTAPSRTKPEDHLATEVVATLMQVRQQWDNADGSVTIVGDLEDRRVIKGTVEARGELKPGSSYRFLGQWIEHDRHGWQFHFDAALLETPDDPDGIAAYLARHADQVGLVKAARLVAAYGSDAVRVLIEDTSRVAADGILTATDAGLAAESLRRVYADPAMREAHLQLFALLRGHGFYAKAMKAALRRWRASAPAQVRRDPFLLMTAGLPGCGFLKCDRMWLALGKSPRRLKRQALAAWHALAQLDGDTWAPAQAALDAVRRQIGGTSPRERRAVALLCRAGLAETRTDGDGQVWVAERSKAVAERRCAHMVRLLGQGEARWPSVDQLGLVPASADQANDQHQIDQLRVALSSAICLLTGSPGTGKTYCAAQVIRATMRKVGSEKIAVVAPTGKAAVRIGEKLAELKLPVKATTIHSCLKVRTNDADGWGFEHGPENPLPFSHLFLDEGSMPDVSLMAAFLGALTPGVNLMIIGDPHQLPPVGHGAFLRDCIAAAVNRGHLSEIRRNAGLIVRACHEIKDGKVPKLPQSLGDWPNHNLIQLAWGGERAERQRALEDRIDGIYEWLPRAVPPEGVKRWPVDLIDDVQVIAPRNATVDAINLHLQSRLNAAGQKGPGGFRVGDKVICTRNGFAISAEDRNFAKVYVANGDIGRVRLFEGRSMVVDLATPRRSVIVPLGRAAEEQMEEAAENATGEAGNAAGSWKLAYAITCHRAQGSEMPVVIFLAEGCGKLGSRELIYTGISRARSLCLIVGDTADIRRYVKNVTLPDRKTFLEPLITGALEL